MKTIISITKAIITALWDRKRNATGFTILELMVVIALIAIITAVSIPSFETLVYGSDINRAVDEFVGDIQLARMKAIRTQAPVTVTFIATNQYSITWTENNVVQTRIKRFRSQGERVVYQNHPPGASPAPLSSFVFTPMGLFDTSLGNTMGNVYLVDVKNNSKLFRIVTTASGNIEERRWLGSNWEGTPLSVN